jgi:putative transposase
VLLRLAYLTVTNAFAALRLLPVGDRNKDVEILALRHQITVLERQLGADRVKFAPEDRAFVAALLAPLPRQVLRRLRLLMRPDTMLRWHRDLTNHRHARTCRLIRDRDGKFPPSSTRSSPTPASRPSFVAFGSRE